MHKGNHSGRHPEQNRERSSSRESKMTDERKNPDLDKKEGNIDQQPINKGHQSKRKGGH
ncbi:hypothetical protein ACE38W_12745 [Chitinophaga sp. Hz27]|uniref:hypothetical protein n=1 Tax=Chitinophaga sp. Hz27 TaxID=3347169 RepID=UPI0035DC24B7